MKNNLVTQKSWKNASDACLIHAAAAAADQSAIDEVWARENQALEGYVRARVDNPADFEDVLQDARFLIHQKLTQFDSTKGTFVAFCRYWSGIGLLRFWRKEYGYREFFRSFAELRSRFPDIENEEEVVSLFWDFTPDSQPEPMARDCDLFHELFLKVLSGRSAPHMIFAFLLVKLLEWRPREVVAELSTLRLAELLPRVKRELFYYYSISGLWRPSGHCPERI